MFRLERVVREGYALVLWDGFGGLKLAGVEAAVGVIVEGDAKLLRGLEAEGEKAESGGLIAAGGYGRFGGYPECWSGFGFGHVIASGDWMRAARCGWGTRAGERKTRDLTKMLS